MAIGDKDNSYIISGTGDVLEPEGDVIGIGSGGNYALAAGKVLMETDKNAEEIEYLNIPKVNLKEVIVDYKQVISDLSSHYKDRCKE